MIETAPTTGSESAAPSATGVVFNIQRFSTEDGPGIRTTVFAKGCPLRCRWCHNPEGLSPHPQLAWYDVRCIGARRCLAACPESALELSAGGMRIDRDRCTACDRCSDACPSGALEIIGWRRTAEAVFAEVAKDIDFYQASGGGLTVSGGEPAMQPEFVGELLERCRAAGIPTALDTCGYAEWSVYERLLPRVDLVLFDLKIADWQRHRDATGVDTDRIFANAAAISERGADTWIRTPVIPGCTDDPENIAALAAFIRARLPSVRRWDLLPYTKLGRPKYHRLDIPYLLEEVEPPTTEEMGRLAEIARESGVPVVLSGGGRG